MIKKVIMVLLIIVMFIPFKGVKATTLKQYEDKVKKYQNELNAAKAAIKKTEQQIQNTKNDIQYAKNQVQKLQTEIEELKKEVENGKEEIKEKGLETKEFFGYLQLADDENAYLEYAFGAENMTDFIYRLSIVEQMTEYNNRIIEDLENMIDRNTKREAEIKKKQQQLNAQQKTLNSKVISLGEAKESLESGGVDSAKQLKIYQEIVASYKKLGCKSNDVIGVDCAVNGPAGKFRRPTKVGLVSSEVGYRWGKLHRGIDITSPNKKKEKIYAIANGTVSAKYTDTSGAKCVIVEHYDTPAKVWYTSIYCHLSSFASNIYVGRYLTSDDYVGYMGNTGYVVPAPTPSNPDAGTHLHLEVAKCKIYKDNNCGTWSKYVNFFSRSFSNGWKGARSVISFPKTGVKWTTR